MLMGDVMSIVFSFAAPDGCAQGQHDLREILSLSRCSLLFASGPGLAHGWRKAHIVRRVTHKAHASTDMCSSAVSRHGLRRSGIVVRMASRVASSSLYFAPLPAPAQTSSDMPQDGSSALTLRAAPTA